MGVFHQLVANHSRMVSNTVMRKFLLVIVVVLLAVGSSALRLRAVSLG